jgi:hypothetical protein
MWTPFTPASKLILERARSANVPWNRDTWSETNRIETCNVEMDGLPSLSFCYGYRDEIRLAIVASHVTLENAIETVARIGGG